MYPQLIQLQSYRRQRILYFKGQLGIQNSFKTDICSCSRKMLVCVSILMKNTRVHQLYINGMEDNIIELSLVAGQLQQQLQEPPASQATTKISQMCTHHLAISNAGTTSARGRLHLYFIPLQRMLLLCTKPTRNKRIILIS